MRSVPDLKMVDIFTVNPICMTDLTMASTTGYVTPF